MSREYRIPADIHEKEKVIGGILTFGQFGWICMGAGIGIALFIFNYLTFKNAPLSLIMGLIGISTGLPFAFLKKGNLPLAIYFERKRNFNKKNKKIINIRKDV